MTPAAGQAAAPARTALTAAPGPHRDHRDHRDDPRSHASADLAAELAAAARARRLTRDTLARWHLDHLTEDAQAIASELAANAISAAVPPRAALPAIIFAVHQRASEIRIIVWDNGPGRPRRAEPGPDAEHGRGLAIIDTLTHRNWGWWPTPESGGKVVWAALRAADAHPDGRDRPC